MIAVDAAVLAVAERRAAVGGVRQADAADVEVLVVLRVDADLREVHRPRIQAIHALPGVAGVIRTEDAAGLERVLTLPILDVHLLAAEAAAVRLRRRGAAGQPA